MLKIRLIPLLLYKDSCLVKSVQFSALRNLGNPVQMVKVYNARSVDELIFLDIAATGEKRPPLFDTIGQLSEECFMPLTIGGGIKNISEIRTLLQIGADKVSLNTHAVKNPLLIQEAAQRFGSQSIVVSIDVKRNKKKMMYEVFINGGKKPTGIDAKKWSQEAVRLGAGELLITSIDQDGTMKGFDTELISQISSVVSIPLIASGGAGKPENFVEAVKNGANAVAAASIFQYTHHTPNSIKSAMKQSNIPVRI